MRFNGSDYVSERDDARLANQFERIKNFMLNNGWKTLSEIQSATGDPPASISAQLRHLRKPRFGSYTVEKRLRGNSVGLYEYQVLEAMQG